jgi:hypothetical protein
MDKSPLYFALCYNNDKKSVPISKLPTYEEVISYAKSFFPPLQNQTFTVGYMDDENDLVYAKSDLELKEAYRLAMGSNEVQLLITTIATPMNDSGTISKSPVHSSYPISIPEKQSQHPDQHLSKSITQLKQVVSDLSQGLMNYQITIENERLKAEDLKKKSKDILDAETEKQAQLEFQIKQAQESLAIYKNEQATLKESVSKIGQQLLLKYKDVAELKKDNEAKLLLEAKLADLEKQLSSKMEEQLTMSRRIDHIKIERDHFSKKATELENKLPTFENDLIRSFSLPTSNTPINTPISSPSSPIPIYNPPTNIYTPPLVPIKPKPDILIPPTVIHNGSPLTTNMNNSNVNDPYKNISFPTQFGDTPSLPPDIQEVDIQVLESMGFSLDYNNREKIYALLRKHKSDISKVINELIPT